MIVYITPYAYFPTDTQLIGDIERAVNGEYSAVKCYAQIARKARNDEERNQILEIRNDEKRHFREFSHIYTQLTGRQPSPKVIESCPEEYCQSLDFALKDEQKTVDFYLDISEKGIDPFIKEMFRRAAQDEQNHAVWFLYYWTRNGCPTK